MSIKRITISVPETVAGKIKKAAGTTPVSQWITDVIEDRLDDAELDRLWQEFYQSVGPSRADSKRARALFKRLAQQVPRGRAA